MGNGEGMARKASCCLACQMVAGTGMANGQAGRKGMGNGMAMAQHGQCQAQGTTINTTRQWQVRQEGMWSPLSPARCEGMSWVAAASVKATGIKMRLELLGGWWAGSMARRRLHMGGGEEGERAAVPPEKRRECRRRQDTRKEKVQPRMACTAGEIGR